MKKLFLGLPFLFLQFCVSDLKKKDNHSEIKQEKLESIVEEKKIPSTSLRFDNNYSQYEDDFEIEKKFWMARFTLSSSEALLYNRKTMEILDTIASKELGNKKTILDSVYKANNEKRWRKTYDITPGRREDVCNVLRRAFLHIDDIIDSLELHCLPNELAAIPFIESGYLDDAKSCSGAVGMWQFMRSSAKDYGLKVNKYIDERRNNKKSLSAAIKYFKKSHEKFDSPLLAVVSYNTGMNHRYFKNQYNKTDVEVVKAMGFYPRNYFPMFLASLEILHDPYKYYPELEEEL